MTDIQSLSEDQLKEALGHSTASDITKLSYADLQKAVAPADESPQMKDAQWGVQNPYLRALQTSATQAIVNPVVQTANTLAPALRGIYKGIGADGGGSNIQGPDMSQAPVAAKVLGDVTAGAGQGLAATAMGAGNPLIGYGELAGLGAYGDNKPVLPAVAQGVTNAVPQLVGGAIGAKAAGMVAGPLSRAMSPLASSITKYAPNVGTSLGMGGAAAAQAAASGQDPVQAAASGAIFGLVSPMGGPKQMSTDQFNNMVAGHADIIRNVVRPGQGEILRITNNSGNIDDAFNVMARNGIVIHKDADNKLDTTGARTNLWGASKEVSNQLDGALRSVPEQQFNLSQIAADAKSHFIKNADTALEGQEGSSHVDDYINAEIVKHSQMVDGLTLNKIKQGMWKVSYNNNAPNTQDAARSVGFAAKSAIEKAYPDENIQGLNKTLGDYATANSLLDRAQGRVVVAGRLGQYFAKTVGAGVGTFVGAHLPFGGEVAGPLAGWQAGGKLYDFINDPKRITEGLSNRIKNIQVTDTPMATPKTTVVDNPKPVASGPLGVTYQTMALPHPKDVAYNPSLHAGNPSAMITPNVNGKGTIYAPDANKPLGLPFIPAYEKLRTSTRVIPPRASIPDNSIKPSGPAVPVPNKSGIEQFVTPKSGEAIKLPGETQKALPPSKTVYGQGFTMNPVEDGISNPSSLSTLNPIVQQGKGATLNPNMNILNNKGNASLKMLGPTMALGLGLAAGAMNPSAQAQQVKEPQRLHLPSPQYTQKEERWSATPYIDTRGHKTIGYGFNMDDPGTAKYLPQAVLNHQRGLTKPEADKIFNKVYGIAQENAQKFAGQRWHELSYNQKKALTDMSYNMGSAKLNGFHNLKQAIQDSDYDQASREILNSKYGKKDAPNRAMRNSFLMKEQA